VTAWGALRPEPETSELTALIRFRGKLFEALP
jgi:hypothetical protein